MMMLMIWAMVHAAEPKVYVMPQDMVVKTISGLDAIRQLDKESGHVYECRAVVLDKQTGKLKSK